jgi:hypothetical protein
MATENKPGFGVDWQGNPVIDPTANVLELVAAERRRTDDLRKADRLLGKKEHRSIEKQLKLHFRYTEKLMKAEADRINAIRAVDVAAVSVASSKTQDQANVLANQVTASADALRTLVSSTASTLASQLTQIIEPIMGRLAELEKKQYENTGKTQVTDPIAAQVLIEIKALREGEKTRTGQSMGLAQALGWIIAAIAIVGFLITKLR